MSRRCAKFQQLRPGVVNGVGFCHYFWAFFNKIIFSVNPTIAAPTII